MGSSWFFVIEIFLYALFLRLLENGLGTWVVAFYKRLVVDITKKALKNCFIKGPSTLLTSMKYTCYTIKITINISVEISVNNSFSCNCF